jgi:hypothetical protein
MSQGVRGVMVGDDSKVCAGCGETKPLDAYYKNKGGLAGRQSRCRPCFIKQVRAPSDYRQRKNARSAVRHAIKTGKFTRPTTCSACWASPVYTHGHHDDYSKPLDVRWVCKPCHDAIHIGDKYERHS